jgi:uncharacterized protein
LIVFICSLIFDLFQEVLIPQAVCDELGRNYKNLPIELKVAVAHDTADVARLRTLLDAGEAEAIALSKELQADAVLIDEKKGRRVAEEEGLTVVGLLAVIVLAREKQLISSVKELLDDLQTRGGFYVSARMRQKVLAEAGEN